MCWRLSWRKFFFELFLSEFLINWKVLERVNGGFVQLFFHFLKSKSSRLINKTQFHFSLHVDVCLLILKQADRFLRFQQRRSRKNFELVDSFSCLLHPRIPWNQVKKQQKKNKKQKPFSELSILLISQPRPQSYLWFRFFSCFCGSAFPEQP
jgi:hypothetical protein